MNENEDFEMLDYVPEAFEQLNVQNEENSLIASQNRWKSIIERESLAMRYNALCELVVNRIPRQMDPKFARADMIKNHAHGFVFAVSDETRVRRYLILGSSGGTYYATERDHTIENLQDLIDIIERGNGAMIIREIREISLSGRNPKQEPLLFALALCARYRVSYLSILEKEIVKVELEGEIDPKNDAHVKLAYSQYLQQLHAAALAIVNDVCRIPTHLFQFVKFCQIVAASTGKGEPLFAPTSIVEEAASESMTTKKGSSSVVGGRQAIVKKGKKPPNKPVVVSIAKADKSKIDKKKVSGRGSTGWGRAMRRCISKWFGSKTPDHLAMLITKYQQREGWAHRDLFRLAHPSMRKHTNLTDSDDRLLEYEQIFRFIVRGKLRKCGHKFTSEDKAEFGFDPVTKYTTSQLDKEMQSKALNLIYAVQKLKSVRDEDKIVEAIQKYGLVREHIPTQMLDSVPIWHALLERMPLTALIRNLGKLSSIDAFDENTTAAVVAKLNDETALRKARIHPLNVLLAKTTYDNGCGLKGKLSWFVNKQISAALEDAFYKSFVNVSPTGKRFCLALDVSGSMWAKISGTHLPCTTASVAMAMTTLRTEPYAECVAFTHELTKLHIKREWNMDQIIKHTSKLNFGRTDCAKPMLWAAKKERKFDVFVVYTDNETYFGNVHPYEALRQYRKISGVHDARLIVMGMTSTRFTIADPTDAGMLDIAGFDSAVPALIHGFIKGYI